MHGRLNAHVRWKACRPNRSRNGEGEKLWFPIKSLALREMGNYVLQTLPIQSCNAEVKVGIE